MLNRNYPKQTGQECIIQRMSILDKLFSPGEKSPLKPSIIPTDRKNISANASARKLTAMLHESLLEAAVYNEKIGKAQAQLQQVNALLSRRKYDALRPIERKLLKWVSFLCDPARLEAHLTAVSVIRQTLAARTGMPGQLIHVQIFPVSGIFSFSRTGKQIELNLHECMILMTPAELREFAGDLCSRRKKNAAQLARQVFFRKDAREMAAIFAETIQKKGTRTGTKGAVYDLNQLFEKVNAEHFGSRLEKPVLKWSAKVNRSRFGSYSFRTDTVILNRQLDRAAVPGTVVEFVLYHELLHKALGYKVGKGRIRSHTAEFRQREKRFPGYDRIKNWLSAESFKSASKR